MGLSQWLFNVDNPLTARVAVNRYWQMIFGRGIVDTPDDFGAQGSLPTHPALLDWLAVEFMDSGWDVKNILKTMVMSATYQQASKTDSISLAFDPDNKWLSRGRQQRLTSEMLRDQALKISGLLNSKVGGPSVKPFQPKGLWTQVSSGGRYQRKYMVGKGKDLYRRSLYTYWKRTVPPPGMITFDASTRDYCTVERQKTSTPLQALVLLNDPQLIEASTQLAVQVLKNEQLSDEDRIERIFRKITSRKPDLSEIDNLLTFLADAKNEYSEAKTGQLKTNSTLDLEQLSKKNVYAFSMLTSLIFNLDEAIVKG